MRLVVVDGTNLFMMSYAVNKAVDRNGRPYGGAKGVLISLKNIIRELDPDKLIFVWDGKGGSIKKRSIYKEYKEGRKPIVAGRNFEFSSLEEMGKNKQWQTSIAKLFIDLLPVCQITMDNCEADDVISYAATNYNYFNCSSVIIVSCDKDFYQLVNNKTLIYNRASKKLITEQDILNEYNIHPNNWLVAKSLSGDNSDNIDGIDGIGFKTAAKLFELNSDKEVPLEEIKSKSEILSEGKKLPKKYKSILENFQLIERNYKIMNLKDSLLSVSDKEKISFQIENFSPSLKRKDIYLYLMKLGEKGIGIDPSVIEPFVKLLNH